jgi:hypothetical protein
MHDLTRRALREAATRGAVLSLDAHYDAVAALDAVACGTAAGGRPVADADPLDRPVVVGDPEPRFRISGCPALLYSPSYAALDWMQDASAWFEHSPSLGLLAGCWALAHARDPRALRGAADAATARKAVRAWGRKLNCSVRALAAAYTRIMMPQQQQGAAREPGESPAKPSPEDRGIMLRHALLRLQAEFGGDDDYWLFGPAERFTSALSALRQKDEAEDAALAKAEKRTVARNPESPAVLAFRRWRQARKAFFTAIGLNDE